MNNKHLRMEIVLANKLCIFVWLQINAKQFFLKYIQLRERERERVHGAWSRLRVDRRERAYHMLVETGICVKRLYISNYLIRRASMSMVFR